MWLVELNQLTSGTMAFSIANGKTTKQKKKKKKKEKKGRRDRSDTPR